MAKYDVKHACGHTREYQLFGKNSERERKIEWLATQDCPDCRAAAEARRRDETIAGTIFEPVVNVELTGSEKQIAWAKSIRKIIAFDGSQFIKVKCKGEPSEKQLTLLNAVAKFMATKTESKFWIEKTRIDDCPITRLPHDDRGGELLTTFVRLFNDEIKSFLQA